MSPFQVAPDPRASRKDSIYETTSPQERDSRYFHRAHYIFDVPRCRSKALEVLISASIPQRAGSEEMGNS